MSLSTLYHLDFLVASIDDQNELIDYFLILVTGSSMTYVYWRM